MAYNLPDGRASNLIGQTTDNYNRGSSFTDSNLIKFFSSVYPRANTMNPTGATSGQLGRTLEKMTLDQMTAGMSAEISNVVERVQFIVDNFYYLLLPIQQHTSHAVEWHTTIFEPKIPSPLAPRALPRLLGARKIKGQAALTRQGIGFEIDLETLHIKDGSRWYAEHLLQAVASVQTGNKLSILWSILTAHQRTRVYLNNREYLITIGIPGIYEQARRNFGFAQKMLMPLQSGLRMLADDAAKMRVTGTNIAVLLSMATLSRLAETVPRYNEFYRAGNLAVSMLRNGGSTFLQMIEGTVYPVSSFVNDSGPMDLMKMLSRIGLAYNVVSPYAKNGVNKHRNAISRTVRLMDFRQRRFAELSLKEILLASERYDRVTGALNEFSGNAPWANLDPSSRDPNIEEDMFLYEANDGTNKPVKYWGQMRTDLWDITDMLDLGGSMMLQLDEEERVRFTKALNTLFEAITVSEERRSDKAYFQYLEDFVGVNTTTESHASGSNQWGAVAPIETVNELKRNAASLGCELPYAFTPATYRSVDTEERVVNHALTAAESAHNNATNALTAAENELTNAREALTNATTDDTRSAANIRVISARNSVNAAQTRVDTATNELNNARAAMPRHTAKVEYMKWNLPPGIITGAGLRAIKNLYASSPEKTFLYGISKEWAIRISELVDVLTALAQKISSQFPKNLLTNRAYAPSWMYNPTEFDVLVYTLTRERPVLWFAGIVNPNGTKSQPATEVAIGWGGIAFFKSLEQSVEAARTTLASVNMFISYVTPIIDQNTPKAYFEVATKRAILARFLQLVLPKFTKRGTVTDKTPMAVLLEKAELATRFPPSDSDRNGQIGFSLRDSIEYLKQVVTSNPTLFVTAPEMIVTDLQDNLNRFESDMPAVLDAMRALPPVAAGVAIVYPITYSGAMSRSTMTISPAQIKQLAEIYTTNTAAIVAVPSNVHVIDTFMIPSEIIALADKMTNSTRRMPLSLVAAHIASNMTDTIDFGAAHRVTVIRDSLNGDSTMSKPIRKPSISKSNANATPFGGLVSNPFAKQQPVGADANEGNLRVGRQVTGAMQDFGQATSWLGTASRSTFGGSNERADTFNTQPPARRATAVHEQLRSLDVAVADLVNEHFAERYNAAFNQSVNRLQCVYTLAMIMTPNNWFDSLCRWLDLGFDVPVSACLIRDFYADTYPIVRMIPGSETGGFLQGPANTWWGFSAQSQIYGLYYTYYAAPFVKRPENIQIFRCFDLVQYRYGGGTGFCSGKEYASNPNEEHEGGNDLVAIMTPLSSRTTESIFSPSGKLELVSPTAWPNAPVIDQRFVNRTFENWRLRLNSRRNTVNYEPDNIYGAVVMPDPTSPAYYFDHLEFKNPSTGHYDTYTPAQGPWASSAVEPSMRDAIDGLKVYATVDRSNWNMV